MLAELMWNGTGIVCVVVSAGLVQLVFRALHSQPRAIVRNSLVIGSLTSLVNGPFCGFILFWVAQVMPLEPFAGIWAVMRTAGLFAGTIAGTLVLSAAVGFLLRKRCHPRAVMYITGLCAALMTAYPVLYGWGTLVAKLFR